MADTIVGMMFAKNEVDILPKTIPEAIKLVDSLFIADDGSVDGTWDLIKYFKHAYPDKIEHIQQLPSKRDPAQRNSLLGEIRNRYKPENTWVQMIEADIVLYTNDLHATIANANKNNVNICWHNMNAARADWSDIHSFYPHWPEDISKVMPLFHWIEEFPAYSFRPLPKLEFDSNNWRPWPRGFTNYLTEEQLKRGPRAKMKMPPLTLHYGYRGPTHLWTKWQRNPNKSDRPMIKHGIDYTSLETLTNTFPYFNGKYNRNPHTLSNPVEAWKSRG